MSEIEKLVKKERDGRRVDRVCVSMAQSQKLCHFSIALEPATLELLSLEPKRVDAYGALQ